MYVKPCNHVHRNVGCGNGGVNFTFAEGETVTPNLVDSNPTKLDEVIKRPYDFSTFFLISVFFKRISNRQPSDHRACVSEGCDYNKA